MNVNMPPIGPPPSGIPNGGDNIPPPEKPKVSFENLMKKPQVSPKSLKKRKIGKINKESNKSQQKASNKSNKIAKKNKSLKNSISHAQDNQKHVQGKGPISKTEGDSEKKIEKPIAVIDCYTEGGVEKRKLIAANDHQAIADAAKKEGHKLRPIGPDGKVCIRAKDKGKFDLSNIELQVDDDAPEELKKFAESVKKNGIQFKVVSDQHFEALMNHFERQQLNKTKEEAKERVDQCQQCLKLIPFLNKFIAKIRDKEVYSDRNEFEKVIEGTHSLVRDIPDGLAFFTSGTRAVKSKRNLL